jgi:hypothetical protein
MTTEPLRTDIFHDLRLKPFPSDAFVVTSLASAVLTFVVLALLAHRSRLRILHRPAYLFAAAAHVFHQWPLALLSPVIGRNLADPWFFLVAVCAPVVTGIAVSFRDAGTPDPTGARDDALHSGPYRPRVHGPVLAATGVLAGTYLVVVDWTCTGLYAYLVDPEMSLFAREFSGKLLPNAIAFYAHGALVNVLVPILTTLSVGLVVRGLSGRTVIPSCAGVLLLGVSLALALTPGAKGALVPSLVVATVCFVVLRQDPLQRALSIGLLILFVAGPLVMFDKAREFGALFASGATYDVVGCTQRYGVCEASRTLLGSSLSRAGSLGLSEARTRSLLADLDDFCPSPTVGAEEPVAVTPPLVPDAPDVLVPPAPARLVHHLAVTPPLVADAPDRPGGWLGRIGERLRPLADEVDRVAYGVLYRAIVTPIQAASWYFRHAEDHGRVGASGIGSLRRFVETPVNMPALIHEIYYPLFSQGASVSTGTVPVAFYLSYPAVVGWWGVALSIALVLGFDALTRVMMRRLPQDTCALCAGLIAAVVVNGLSSEFGTVLLSHGGWLVLTLMAVWVIAARNRRASAA